MNKVLDNVKKEIEQIGEQGINANNIDVLYKLVDIEKDIYEICSKKNKMSIKTKRLEEYNYSDEHGYNKTHRKIHDHRFLRRLENLVEDIEEYQCEKEEYDEDGALRELERLMYSLCDFIEYIHDSTDIEKEREIIKHHLEELVK